jgi:pilus assembly protein CpaB
MRTELKSSTLVAGLAGLLALVMMWVYISSRESQLLQLSEMKDVVVARRDIVANSVIDETMVEHVQVPSRYLQPSAATALNQAIGRVTVVPVLSGGQIVTTQLDDPGLNALAYEVPRGRRAVTVSVSDVTGVGGLVRPGNFVDVFGTFDYGKPVGMENGVIRYSDERTETRLMLQNVPVIAVGRDHRRAAGEVPPAAATPETAEQRQLREIRNERGLDHVTMLVEPKQAQELILAQEIGTLSLVLRSNLDAGAIADFGTLDPLQLLNAPVPVKRRAPAWREMRGGMF